VHQSGSVEIDFERRQLFVRGQPVVIGDRAFAILELLVGSAGELVPKDAILAQVWPGVFVGDNTLDVHISSLRKALGENRGLLKTAYGRGYRVLGPWTLKGTEERRVTQPRSQAVDRTPLTNLPLVSGLIGRDAAVSAVVALLADNRFVTLVGTGGIGKTRLAFEVGRRLLPAFDDGIWLVELGSLSDPSLVPGAVASVLGIDIAGSGSPIGLIAQALRSKRLLLVLDTCEHLVEAAARLGEAVLRAGAGIRVLATSREALRTEGEHLYPVPPLSIPADGTPAEQMAEHSAVQLFLARATAAEPDFPTDDNSLAISGLFCRRLDGIPLAIELAAARAVTLGMDVLAARLDDRLKLLGGGRRTALSRHQTLGATLDWSYELLTAMEQAVLRRLSILAGSFDIDAATCVAPDDDLDAGAVVEHVAELVTKSLLVSEAAGASRRYRLLDTTRAYALEKLGTGEERQNAARRHARYCRDLL
jgi:predicted ATPase/DNA-binding winged helix-turn-helix (wHTH) protein